jgi:hypothetical protein
MATISLEGTGTSISFGASGFSADIISVDLNERARQTIETTHLGTKGAKTYKPGEVVDLGEMTVVVDHNPNELQLVGYPVESIVISYPLQAGEVVPTKIPLFGLIIAQGDQQMQMDKRMVTKLKVKLSNSIEEPYRFITEFIQENPAELYGFSEWFIAENTSTFRPTLRSFPTYTVT